MRYPLISEYVRAIADSAENLDCLSYLTPVFDSLGEPLHSSGAFAVVFKMEDSAKGRYYALKCFTEDQFERKESYDKISEELEKTNSSYLINVKYYDNELFVDSNCTDETEFPVLLMDWVDGETMESYIPTHYTDSMVMEILTNKFCKLAAWLHNQTFAHGDIKPDNIMVTPDEELVLIDYDGMFVPSMSGMKSPTLGSRNMSHPMRSADDFNETIDDFSLAAIALSLKATSLEPQLFDTYGASDGILLSQKDYVNINQSEVLKELTNYLSDRNLCQLYANFLSAYAQKDLSLHSFRNFLIS